MASKPKESLDPVTAAILGFLLPGAGHLYGGRFGKGVFFFVLITGTFLAGLILGDFRCVSLKHQPYWFLGQGFAGLPAFAAALFAPDWKLVILGGSLEAGTLYTTVAGLLNVLVILDAAFPARIRLFFNVEEEAVDADLLLERLRKEEGGLWVAATFSSMPSALGSLRCLSFAKAEPSGVAFPAGIRGGLFKTASGARMVLGGALSEANQEELLALLKGGAREADVVDAEGAVKNVTKPWWRLRRAPASEAPAAHPPAEGGAS